MLKEEIINLIDSQSIQNKEKIKSLLLPSLKFSIEDLNPGYLSISKIGGKPPIFENVWPECKSTPLLFLAEISLSQISDINNLLPKDGILCFFILTDDNLYRYPDRKGEFKVLYIENINRENTNKAFMSIKEYPIRFFEHYTLPSYQENILIGSNLTQVELNLIEDIESNISDFEGYDIGHQVLGHPKAIQGTVRFWWAVKYLGLENIETLSEPEEEMAKQEGDKFILLLQLDFSDPKITVDHFGDSVAYFGIHQHDLKNKNFDNVILVMQNT